MRRTLAVVSILLVTSCGGGDIIAPPNSGTLELTTTTTGTDLDPDGYSFQIDGGAAQSVGVNDTVTSNVVAGSHSVQLSGLAATCAVSGDNPQTVSITAGQVTAITFAIVCGASAGTGTLEVRTTTTGSSPDADGYTVSIDGGNDQGIGVNSSLLIPDVAAGAHTVTLNGLAANCSVSGESSQQVTVQAGATATVDFTIACGAATLVWRPMQTGAIVGLLSIWGSSPTDLFAVGETAGGSPLSSILHYDGQQWNPQYTSTDARLMGVWGISPTNVFSVGFAGINAGGGGILLHYDGTGWTDMELPDLFDQAYVSVWGSSPTDVYAVGEYFDEQDINLVAHFDGAAWTPVSLKKSARRIASDVNGTSASNVFVVGNLFPEDGYFLLHFDGSTWTEQDVGSPGILLGVWASGPTDAFAVGQQDGGLILHYDGQSWTPMTVPAGVAGLSDVWGSAPTDVYAVGDGILHYDGTQWTKIADNRGTSVFGLSPTDIYVVNATGVVLHGSP
jgi:hypothetical protein